MANTTTNHQRPDTRQQRPQSSVTIWSSYPGEKNTEEAYQRGDDANAVLAWTAARMRELLPARVINRGTFDDDLVIPTVWAELETPLGEIHLHATFADEDPDGAVLVKAEPAVQCCGPLANWDPRATSPVTRMKLTLLNRDEMAAWIGDAAYEPADPGSDVLLVDQGAETLVIVLGTTVERTANGTFRRLAADEL